MKRPHYPVAAVVLAGLAALVVWWAWPRHAPAAAVEAMPAPVQAALAARPAAVQRVAPAAASPSASILASPSSASSPSLATPAPPQAAASATPDRSPTWQLCGFGPVPAPDEEAEDLPAPLGAFARSAARERTLQALQRGGLRERLAALTWREGPGQPDLAAPTAAEWAAVLQPAADSGDPVAIDWALHGCPQMPDPAACRRALLLASLQADPGNARTWAQWLPDAPDPDAAWTQLLRAARWQTYFGQRAALTQAAVPTDVPAYLRVGLSIEVLSDESAAFDALLGVAPRCRPPLPPGSPAQAACSRLAELMVEHGDTLPVFKLGRRFGQNAGWAPERLAALDAEFASLWEASRAAVPPHPQPYDCAAVQALSRHLDQVARAGELPTLRALQGRQRR